MLVAQSCPTLCDPMDCSPLGSCVHEIFQARILEWVRHFLLQGIFLTQGSNPGLLYCRQILYQLSYKGSPKSAFSSVTQLYPTLRPHECHGVAVCQDSLSITNSWSLLKLMSMESVMPSSHRILCRPLVLLPPIPPSSRVFSNESTLRMRWPKYWSFSISFHLLCLFPNSYFYLDISLSSFNMFGFSFILFLLLKVLLRFSLLINFSNVIMMLKFVFICWH